MHAHLPDSIRSLEDLRDVLEAAARADDEGATDARYALRFGLPLGGDGLIDLWDLPAFGGDDSYRFDAWSWDAERLLVGDDILDLEIVPRPAEYGEEVAAVR